MRGDRDRAARFGVLGALICFLVLGLSAAGSDAAAESAEAPGYRIIVHRDNPADSISRVKVSQLFLKKISRWDHGPEAEPVDRDAKSAVRESFSRAVHGRSVSSIKNYWQRQQQLFSGKAVPPPEVASDADVIAHVRSRPGGIGYVSPNAKLDDVKVVRVVGGELP